MKQENMMAIKRSIQKGNFIIINKTCFQDNRLSWKAKGVYACIMSLSGDRIIKITEVIKYSTSKRTALMAGIKELIEFGYCIVTENKNLDGTMKEYDYHFKESPGEGIIVNIKDMEKRKKKAPRKFNPNSLGGKIAQFMLDKIEEKDPSFKTPEMGNWEACFNKMIFMDSYDPDEIKKIINYASSDNFWKFTMADPYILRRNYYKIKIRMLNPLNREQTREEKRNVFEEAKREHDEI